VYISASHSDGTSISLLEAFATGTPVIVPDIPGNREWVTPGENGWLFPDGDVQALASTIMNAVDQRQNPRWGVKPVCWLKIVPIGRRTSPCLKKPMPSPWDNINHLNLLGSVFE
jgi:glycosyltransferase involved in cell wall biosynthesis